MGRIELHQILHSPEETHSFGRELASRLSPNTVLALEGALGAGKTTLVQGLAEGLGISEAIQSPTFPLLQPYLEGSLPLFHFDLYRLSHPQDFERLGFIEFLQAGGICAIEWPERAAPYLPSNTLWISLTHLPHQGQGGREIAMRHR